VEPERPLRQQVRELARLFVVSRPFDGAAAAGDDFLDLPAGADRVRPDQLFERLLRRLAAVDAGGAAEDDGGLDVLQVEPALRRQILGEETDGTRVLAFQEVVIEVSLWLRTHAPIIRSHVYKAQ